MKKISVKKSGFIADAKKRYFVTLYLFEIWVISLKGFILIFVLYMKKIKNLSVLLRYKYLFKQPFVTEALHT